MLVAAALRLPVAAVAAYRRASDRHRASHGDRDCMMAAAAITGFKFRHARCPPGPAAAASDRISLGRNRPSRTGTIAGLSGLDISSSVTRRSFPVQGRGVRRRRRRRRRHRPPGRPAGLHGLRKCRLHSLGVVLLHASCFSLEFSALKNIVLVKAH